MHPVLAWGLDFIRSVQHLQGPAVAPVWRVFTGMGEEMFLLFLLPLIAWCVDYGAGLRLAAVYLCSTYLNCGLKDLVREPRPYSYDPSVKLVGTTGYSFPSNHAQSAVAVWGYLAATARRKWCWYVALALMLSIGASRVCLGVHFPTDVLAGWILGAMVLAAFLALQPPISRRLERAGTGFMLLAALILPLVLLFFYHGADSYVITGTMAGLGAGAVLERGLHFDARGPIWQRVLRFLAGAAILAGLYFGLSVALPGHDSSLYLPFRFVRYAVVGFWASYGAPWLFVRLGLQGKP